MSNTQRERSWHDQVTLAKKGSMWYVVDENGEKASDGFHELTPLGCGEFRGKRGANTETFSVSDRPGATNE